MSGVLIIERIVLESLEKKSKNLEEIHEDTKLDTNLIKSILSHLINKGIVSMISGGQFELNKKNQKNWIKEINNKKAVSFELKELFSSLVNNYFKEEVKQTAQLKMKKVYLTKSEKDALDQKFKEIDQFLAQIANERQRLPRKEVTAEKQVLIWGHSPYKALVDEQLEAV
jgi:DNA-binding IscR family transcriptional regulator